MNKKSKQALNSLLLGFVAFVVLIALTLKSTGASEAPITAEVIAPVHVQVLPEMVVIGECHQ